MNFLPRPLVAPPPSSKDFGRKLARLIATMRKREREHPEPLTLSPNTTTKPEIP